MQQKQWSRIHTKETIMAIKTTENVVRWKINFVGYQTIKRINISSLSLSEHLI